jgi:hypothetical protein
MATGHRDTRDTAIFAGWDASELQKFELQDGKTYAEVLRDINAGIAAFNMEIYNHPLFSALCSYSDRPDVSYRQGASNGFGRFTEYGRPDAGRADMTGHMLPLKDWDRRLGWTWKYLTQEARSDQIMADVQDAITDARDLYRVQVLTRMLQRGDDSGDAAGLGSTGYSPGFATAAASTNVDFTPPTHAGTTFTSDHEHYVGIAGGAFTAAVFTDAHNELREHGHKPPYDFVIGESDKAAVKALTGFVDATESWVNYSALTDRATFSTAEVEAGIYPIGALNEFRIWVVSGMPQYYGFGFKSYGPNSQRNPLRIRLPKGQSRPQFVVMPDPRSGAGGAYPLQDAMIYVQFGVGVYDRTAATARYVNNATWADGSPS